MIMMVIMLICMVRAMVRTIGITCANDYCPGDGHDDDDYATRDWNIGDGTDDEHYDGNEGYSLMLRMPIVMVI